MADAGVEHPCYVAGMSESNLPEDRSPAPLSDDARVSRLWVIAFLVVTIPLSFGLLGLVIWTFFKAI